MIEQGSVKWFNDAKGYGFIGRQSGEDVFVHFSAIQAGGFKGVQEAQAVEFNVIKVPKGLQAENLEAVYSERLKSGEVNGERLFSKHADRRAYPRTKVCVPTELPTR